MISLDFIRKNKEKVVEAARNKNREIDLDRILTLDDKRKELIQKTQLLRQERNKIAKLQVNEETIRKGKEIKQQLKKLKDELREVDRALDTLLSFVPNIPLPEVPVGKDESANKEIRRWGQVPRFDFPARSHIELGNLLDIIDLKRGVKVAGFRGYFLKNEGAILHFALLWFVFNKLVKKGYIPLIAPAIVKSFALFGSGQFPWGKQDVYQLNDKDAYLAGTAEQPVTAYFSGEVLKEEELPKKFVAFSSCFRKEAGAYGKDTKGLYRLHEFWKVEQVIFGRNDINEAKELHEELQKNCEEILQELKIPYRVVIMSTGEMGEPQIKKYDTESWMPSRKSYGETMSNSIMGDFQTRRLNIRYKKKNGQVEYCYSLNNTALASPRILIALLENGQTRDGSVLIPRVLQPLVGFEKITPK